MHGLIFKIKESHRQDQSESFVIYIIKHIHIHQNIHIYASFFFTTSQMKSLHYDQCLLYFNIHINVYQFVVSLRRNKTNPHHRNKFIPVFYATHLQAFKPKLSTYDQLLQNWSTKYYLYIYVCISWNIFNRIHFFAICDVFLFAIRSFFIYDISIYMIISKVDEAASTNLFFFIIYNSYHIANQLYQYSCTSRTIASSQHHPRETRPLLSQPNLYKIFYIGFTYDKFALYITRNESTLFASSISSIHLFLFLSFIFILHMKF